MTPQGRGGGAFSCRRAQERAAALKPIFVELLEAGIDNPSGLAAALNARAVPGAVGGIWYRNAVVTMLLHGGLLDQIEQSEPGGSSRRAAVERAVALEPLLRDMLAAGPTNPKRIARELTNRGVPSPFGREWNYQTVVSMLRRAGLFDLMRQARSATIAADQRAARLRPVVADIVAADPISQTRVAAKLNSWRIATPSGRPWSSTTAKNLLRRLGLDDRLLAYDGFVYCAAGLRRAAVVRKARRRERRRAVVALLRQWLHEGLIASLGQAARQLDRTLAPRGRRWYRTSVTRILEREAPDLLRRLVPPTPRYLSAATLAQKLGVERRAIYRAVDRGLLIAERRGRKLVFRRDVIEEATAALRQ